MTPGKPRRPFRQERRRHRRVEAPFQVYTYEPPGATSREKLINISRGGAAFESPCLFRQQDFVYLKFASVGAQRAGEQRFSLIGRVRWTGESASDERGHRYGYGVSFDFIDDPAAEEARRHLLRCLRGTRRPLFGRR